MHLAKHACSLELIDPDGFVTHNLKHRSRVVVKNSYARAHTHIHTHTHTRQYARQHYATRARIVIINNIINNVVITRTRIAARIAASSHLRVRVRQLRLDLVHHHLWTLLRAIHRVASRARVVGVVAH